MLTLMNWDTDFVENILQAEDFRQFLSCFFKKTPSRRHPKRLSFQRFADLAGFNAKSFLADVIAGRKHFTPSSFEKTVQALRLNRTWREYFYCLTAIENPLIRGGNSIEDIKARAIELRQILQNAKIPRHIQGESPLVRAFLRPNFPEVYASLGSVEKGSLLSEIQNRSHLAEIDLLNILDELETVGVVEKKFDRYYPVISSLDADELYTSSIFREDFMRALGKARQRFTNQVCSELSLFVTQTFSISSEQMPALKKELLRTIIAFAEKAENAEGDCISEICLSFTHNSDVQFRKSSVTHYEDSVPVSL